MVQDPLSALLMLRPPQAACWSVLQTQQQQEDGVLPGPPGLSQCKPNYKYKIKSSLPFPNLSSYFLSGRWGAHCLWAAGAMLRRSHWGTVSWFPHLNSFPQPWEKRPCLKKRKSIITEPSLPVPTEEVLYEAVSHATPFIQQFPSCEVGVP